MSNHLEVMFDSEEKNMLDFLDKLKSSEKFHRCSDIMKERVTLYISAYRGDTEAMIYLSQRVELEYEYNDRKSH